MARREKLFVGIGSHVVALDATTGEELWRAKLKGATFVTVALVGKRLLGGASGELFCLDPETGGILWHNKLKGLGMGPVAFASGDAVSIAAASAAQAAAAGD